MRRGEVWTVSGGSGYTGKPRLAVIVQDDCFDATLSVAICAFTSDPTEAPLLRIPVDPTEENGLFARSMLMVDKITTVSREKLGVRVGRLDPAMLNHLNRALLVFLGLAGPTRPER